MSIPLLPRGASARTLIAVTVVSMASGPARAGDPYADFLITFVPGVDAKPGYEDPLTVLGAPERFTGEDGYPGVVSAFYPAFGFDEIVSLGCGGAIEIAFAVPVTDDPRNPHGIDLLVFGNASLIDADWPHAIVGGIFGGDGGRIEVSTDGESWVVVPLVEADGPFPTNGYLDTGAYDTEPGTVDSVFTRPVDPAVTVDDLLGLTYDEVRAVYDGSGGGAGVDLAGTGLGEISFVRVTNPCDKEAASIEIDAFCDVAPRLKGDADRDGVVGFSDVLALLAGWGPCPAPPFPCSLDLDGDDIVGFAEILAVLANWTP